jgi:hypothetical protein
MKGGKHPMNDIEAKLILCACRPDGQDQHDPSVKEALDLAEHDPALAAWLAREQTLDASLCSKLSEVKIPATLKAEILAGARVVKPQTLWKDLRTVLSAAAAVALAAIMVWSKEAPHNGFSLAAAPSVVSVPSAGASTLASFRDDMAESFAQMQSVGFNPDLRTSDVDQINQFLTQRVSRTVEVGQIVDNLGDASLFGCRIAQWNGLQVAMLCLRREGQEAHLFVTQKSALAGLDDLKPKTVETCSGYPASAWQDGDKAYVLVGHTPETDLSKFY